VPPELGEEHVRRAVSEVLGEDGYEISFQDTVAGNRSAVETPLMDSIRRFIEREDPGAEVAPVVLPGFSDSHWWRRAFPDCVAYGFFPQRHQTLYDGWPLIHGKDERIDVRDVGFAASCYRDVAKELLG
jgi:acetylornithine deacetylase/succinyl-diaminopimelate desuccinylase-like protein